MPRQCYVLEKGSSYKGWVPDRAGNLETNLLNLLEIEPRSNSRPCHGTDGAVAYPELFFKYEGWNFNSGNYLFTTDTK